MLSLAGTKFLHQRATNRLRRDNAGELVRHNGSNESGALSVGSCLDGGQPTDRLDNRIVNGFVRQGAFVAKAGDGYVNQARIPRAKRILANPQAIDHARSKILNNNIGRCR